jgi:6-phosphogluconate dehydrogenase
MNTFDFGIIGLGVMGRNLEYGRPKICCGRLDLDEEKFFTHTKRIHNTKATIDVKEFVGLIKQPRAIMLLVPAGNL